MSFGQRLDAILSREGVSQSELGRRLGVSSQAVNQWAKGETQPSGKRLEAIAAALAVPVASLMERDDAATSYGRQRNFTPTLSPNVDFNNLIPYEDLVGERDLPVYGSAEGGPDGSLILDNTPVEWVKRPQPLFRVPKGFATFVVGSSMEPAYFPGDRLLVHPSRPPIHNSDVVVYRDNNDGTANALVKRLVRFDDDTWYLRQYNPQGDFELPRGRWPKAMAIVGKYAR